MSAGTFETRVPFWPSPIFEGHTRYRPFSFSSETNSEPSGLEHIDAQEPCVSRGTV